MRWDAIVIGSGFGGSVAALRLAEKGYRVAVLEKGRRFAPDDFPQTNRELRRWLWAPSLGCRGPFRMSFFRHVTALTGVGVGGGSLVYANTLPVPGDSFFGSSSWAGLADWKAELKPHYRTAQQMLGVTANQLPAAADEALRRVAVRIGRAEHYRENPVAVYFGQPGVRAQDPYFDGRGPARSGCIGCGGCMLGCRHGAKNTLDKNYLYLAEGLGVQVMPETEATWVEPAGEGYAVRTASGTLLADRVFLAGGVLGTLELLLKLQASPQGLPHLSSRLGDYVRTNSEALIGVISRREGEDFSRGLAIGSMLQTDEHSNIEPVRYSSGSDFFRLLMAPHVAGRTAKERLINLTRALIGDPATYLRVWLGRRYAERSTVLLYMRALEGHLKIRLGRDAFTGFRHGLRTSPGQGPLPTNDIPEATELARRYCEEIDGVAMTLFSETLLGIPSTAHILGGCAISRTAEAGVIDTSHQVHGYPNLYIVDGAAMSANPGVNPALTITAMAERALSKLPAREP